MIVSLKLVVSQDPIWKIRFVTSTFISKGAFSPLSKKRSRSWATTINIDSESENEKTHAGRKRRKKAYRNQKFLSVSEAMVHVETIWDESCKQELDITMKQRNQHHQMQMAKQKGVLLCLRLELHKQKQCSSGNVQELERADNNDQSLHE